jgi:hypothetical protein
MMVQEPKAAGQSAFYATPLAEAALRRPCGEGGVHRRCARTRASAREASLKLATAIAAT